MNAPTPVHEWLRSQMPHKLRLRYQGTDALQHDVEVPPLGAQVLTSAPDSVVRVVIDRGFMGRAGASTQPAGTADQVWAAFVPSIVAGLIASVAANIASAQQPGWPYWHVVIGVAVGALVFGVTMWWSWRSDAPDASARAQGLKLRHQFMLGLVLLASIGLPLAATSLLVAPADAWFGSIGKHFEQGNATGLARLLLLSFVCAATLFPGLLYFIFDRKRADVVRESFESQIFRLDRHVSNLQDVRARYGARLRELYGDTDEAGGSTKLRFGTRWPVLIGTCAMAGGWITVLLLPALHLAVRPDHVAADVLAMFTPSVNNFSFGLLGAYFFALQLIARRYARGDLHPKTYSMITARIFVVIISSWVVGMVSGDTTATRAFVFVVGVLPEAIYLALREVLAQKLGSLLTDLTSRLPLTHLPGVDLYDRARLEEEGVTNIEGLAHCDLVDLMLSTNVPAPQLVQWVDQAILYLRARELPAAETDATKATSLLDAMHRAGVGRASDLMTMSFDNCKRLDAAPSEDVLAAVQAISGDAMAQRARALARLLAMDQWFADIAYWRTWQQPATVICEVGADGQVQLVPD
jgi:hypothetical protein